MKLINYRHVCYQDLKDYFKKSEYFSDLSNNEKDLIRINLGLIPVETVKTVESFTYSELKELVSAKTLKLDTAYIMTDFQSIYKCEDKILGYPGSDYESKTYKLLLRPSNTGAFNRQVTIIPDTKEENDFNCISWEVEYDFTEESLETESEIMFTKGKIIYLKDHNNNSAPYDFYNIRFKNEDEYITTFEKCEIFYNNHFDIGCYNNVFKGNEVSNNTFKSNCYNNIFEGNCTNNNFVSGTKNNIFKSDINLVTGLIINKTITEDLSDTATKLLANIASKQVLIYLDEQTLTYQIKEL